MNKVSLNSILLLSSVMFSDASVAEQVKQKCTKEIIENGFFCSLYCESNNAYGLTTIKHIEHIPVFEGKSIHIDLEKNLAYTYPNKVVRLPKDVQRCFLHKF